MTPKSYAIALGLTLCIELFIVYLYGLRDKKTIAQAVIAVK